MMCEQKLEFLQEHCNRKKMENDGIENREFEKKSG